ncbi:hypothetical protein [Streptomyces tsukubensis]|uniref:hypothetical protein n=1 Tax=Streptomyces tsukubensis TaxID=83656 RepID=UPI00344ECDAA
MPKRTADQKAARALQRAEGIPYQEALNRVRAAAESAAEPPSPAAVAYVLQPTAAEAALGITAEALGIRALPAGATPAQRAHAEAVWRPQEDPAQPCRCSGTGCHHGEPCTGHDGCTGRLVHTDRYPGSLWTVTTWMDTYACSDYEEGVETMVELPAIPWGEHRTTDRGQGPSTIVYDGVRHPNFGTADDEDDSDEGELDPADHPTPEDDYEAYADEDQDDEELRAEHDQEQEPDPEPDWDDDPRDNSPGDHPDEYDDEHQDHEHDGALSRVPALDPDPQPTADTWTEPRQW